MFRSCRRTARRSSAPSFSSWRVAPGSPSAASRLSPRRSPSSRRHSTHQRSVSRESTVSDPGCLSRIWIFPSRIQAQKDPGSGSASKEFKYDPGCSSRIRILIFFYLSDLGSGCQKGTRSQIRNTARKQCCGYGDPSSNRAKMTRKKREKWRNFMIRRSAGCSLADRSWFPRGA